MGKKSVKGRKGRRDGRRMIEGVRKVKRWRDKGKKEKNGKRKEWKAEDRKKQSSERSGGGRKEGKAGEM